MSAALFSCCCPCRWCLTFGLQNKLTARLCGNFPTLLLPYVLHQRPCFHCNINILVSIRSCLTSQLMPKTPPGPAAGCPHPLRPCSRVTADLPHVQCGKRQIGSKPKMWKHEDSFKHSEDVEAEVEAGSILATEPFISSVGTKQPHLQTCLQ